MKINIEVWHPGQFATVIAGGLIIEWLLFTGIDHFEELYNTDGMIALLALMALTVLIAMLWLSWSWFGGRRKR